MFEIPALWSIEDYRQVFNRVRIQALTAAATPWIDSATATAIADIGRCFRRLKGKRAIERAVDACTIPDSYAAYLRTIGP